VTEPAVHATFIIEKTYPHPLTKVFSAFANPELKSRWFNPGHRQPDASDEHDFRIGGIERTKWLMDETTPFPGAPMTRISLYLDIAPEARIVTGSNMAINGRVFSSSLLTFEFAAEGEATRLTVTHQGAFFEHADGPAMREAGWRKVLERLGESLDA
jgi:uncharacterized protein YndB with AHSA1/START domain